MQIERPDLSHIDPSIKAYIEALEAELARLQRRNQRENPPTESLEPELPLEPGEPPTTLNVITITASGIAKRTPRHLYMRQRRGGMGVFDLEAPGDESPAVLTIADENQSLILFTNLARAFRVLVRSLPESPLRARGQQIMGRTPFASGEYLVAALPDQARGNVAMVSQRGMVRLLRHHVFGEYMKPGTALFDAKQFGPLAAACWTPGDGDLFVATRFGHAIRFSEKLVGPQGGPGIRLEEGDQAVAIAGVYQESSVFMLGADGRGTIRSMEGFNPNKSTGGGGKIAMNTDSLIAAFTIEENDDIFAISRLSKMIRFMAAEVPVKEVVVQGVNCMALRADLVVAATSGHMQ
ncbi:MAG: DNA gyrase C-terminal beta-propeller domain-containing protein [Omnitrophica WOR_2 bacterium]